MTRCLQLVASMLLRSCLYAPPLRQGRLPSLLHSVCSYEHLVESVHGNLVFTAVSTIHELTTFRGLFPRLNVLCPATMHDTDLVRAVISLLAKTARAAVHPRAGDTADVCAQVLA